MGDLTYEQLNPAMHSNYLEFTIHCRHLRSFRLHLGEETIHDESGDPHCFDLIWFRDTGELIAAEVEESLGVVLPLNFRLKKSTDKYLHLGTFTEEGIDDLLVHQGRIIEYLWELHTEAHRDESMTQTKQRRHS